MITAYIDDSKSERNPPVFVLGGYVASDQTWADFSTEWQAELDREPSLAYFKFREGFYPRPTGEFYRRYKRDTAACFARIAVFRRIIEKYLLRGVAIGFRVDEYQEAYKRFGKPHDNPYYFATAHLLPTLARGLEGLWLPKEPLDMVFDDQVMEKTRVLKGWEWVKRHLDIKADPPDLLTHTLRNPPSWQSDKDVVALQAADMHATWMRMTFEAARAGTAPPTIPGQKINLRSVLITYTAQDLRENAAQFERNLRHAGLLA